MDNKRKASGHRASPDADDRAAKRQKSTVAQSDEFNLDDGETPESTTHFGLLFLQQVRRTQDKHGRSIAPSFEKLPEREIEPEYYEHIRMPISLGVIETKLNNGDFATLTELESYTKRMVDNFKRYYPKDSAMWSDSEKIRKAISNHMKHLNPAYKKDKNYTARPTSLPPSEPEDGDAEAVETSQVGADDGTKDEEGEEDADGDGDEEEDDEDDEDEEDEDDDEDDDEDEPIVLPKRRGPGRPPKNPEAHARKMAAKLAKQAKADSKYVKVKYKDLSFQQAQEKILEEIIRKRDPEEEDLRQFEVFITLPPKTLKDYYQIIEEPIALRRLQSMVRGGARDGAAGVSEFKSWAAFEDKVGLLWKNCRTYNDDGSAIFMLSEDLEKFFHAQLAEAKAHVSEPKTIRLKLKSGDSDAKTTTMIRVRSRVGSVGSPAPLTGRSAGSQPGESQGALPNQILQRTRSVSAASPSPSVANGKAEDSKAPSEQPVAAGGATPASSTAALPEVPPKPPKPYEPIWKLPHRQPGKLGLKHCLISKVVLSSFPNTTSDQRIHMEVSADMTQAHVSTAALVPKTHQRVQVIVYFNQYLIKGNDRVKWFYFLENSQLRASGRLDNPQNPLALESKLHPGDMEIQFQALAEIPEEDRVPDGPQYELERFTFYLRVGNY